MDGSAHIIGETKGLTGEVVMRSFIRHPSDVPIEYRIDNSLRASRQRLKNVSFGGLAFGSQSYLAVGADIVVRITGIEPVFEVNGRVVWCRREHGEYSVGVQFLGENDSFRVRMVEQICHIELYKTEVKDKEGRLLSGEEAAQEWIARFAKDFPAI